MLGLYMTSLTEIQKLLLNSGPRGGLRGTGEGGGSGWSLGGLGVGTREGAGDSGCAPVLVFHPCVSGPSLIHSTFKIIHR